MVTNIAIDDFGTGQASLRTTCPESPAIYLDRSSFYLTSGRSNAILNREVHHTALPESLNNESHAEGIETERAS